ncbi:JAB domain-containing protein [Rhodopila sp.]|uniref:JAB domain-containing protein n=1 Tax=Rhodopila sp. TaxID=2480087 RepID=UPI003D0A034E
MLRIDLAQGVSEHPVPLLRIVRIMRRFPTVSRPSGVHVMSEHVLTTYGQAAVQMLRAATIERVQFQDIKELTQYLIARLNDEHTELLLTTFLDCEGFVVAESFSSSIYCPSEVIHRCRELDATYIIVAHKSPGASIRPSLADIIITRALVAAAGSTGICVADYINVGCGQYFSFDEERLLIDPPAGFSIAGASAPQDCDERAGEEPDVALPGTLRGFSSL